MVFKLKSAIVALIFVIMMVGCGGGGGDGTPANPPAANPPVVNPPVVNPPKDNGITSNIISVSGNTFTDSTPVNATVGMAGGTIAVNDLSSPLNGVKIIVPEGATTEDIDFTISYADINQTTGMPAGSFMIGKMIKISANGSDEWNRYGIFDKIIEVTLPYEDPSASTLEESLRYYYYNPENNTLEAEGFSKMDTVNNTITFLTRSFAQDAPGDIVESTALIDVNKHSKLAVGSSAYAIYVLAGLAVDTVAGWRSNSTIIDTGFRAANNGWYIPNYGSYYDESQGGNCMGMVALAKYYHKYGYSPKLYSNYRDPAPTSTWLDDDTAIELASRVHSGMMKIWSQLVKEEHEQKASSYSVALSLVGSLYITNNLTKIGIYQKVVNSVTNRTSKVGGHEISAYRVDFENGEMVFHVYDPNFPNNDTRRITYKFGEGFRNYAGGTDAGSSKYQYNIFYHSGFRLGLTDAVMKGLKESADKDFKDDSKFPTITITSIVGKNDNEVIYDENDKENAKESVTSEGQHKFITSDTSVIIRGTLLGGLSQSECCVVNNLRVLTKNANYSTSVDNAVGSGTGKFEIVLPLLSGENMIAFLGSKRSSYSRWAAFKLDIIESTHSVSDIGVTLAWAKDKSDIDLYVKEPDSSDGTKVGDTVSYRHRKGISTSHPYLDVDNMNGYGPEHYIGIEGMSTLYTDANENPDGLYGTYNIRVHYYADHDDNNDEVQAVPWTLDWRYLQYCQEPCSNPAVDGVWKEQTNSGTLYGVKDYSDWIKIEYEKPNPEDWGTPDSHDIMLP